MDALIPKTSKKKSGGRKKLGRNAKKCARYIQENRRDKNKAKRVARNLKREGRLEMLRQKRDAAA